MPFRRRGHDTWAPAGAGSQDTVVAQLVRPGRRDEGGEPFDELDGLENDMGRPVTPTPHQAVEEAAVGKVRQTLG